MFQILNYITFRAINSLKWLYKNINDHIFKNRFMRNKCSVTGKIFHLDFCRIYMQAFCACQFFILFIYCVHMCVYEEPDIVFSILTPVRKTEWLFSHFKDKCNSKRSSYIRKYLHVARDDFVCYCTLLLSLSLN